MQQKRRTLTVAPTRPSKQDGGAVETLNLAKQLSELRQLRRRVQAAEAARASRDVKFSQTNMAR